MILLCTRVIKKGFSMQRPVVSFVLAGGRGNRLFPLTQERAKPAVPFGGKYRIIDFVLSNLINSGIYSIYVLVQFMSQSLLRHLRDGWQFGGLLQDQFIIPVPAQMRSTDETWYRGTADAIFQNLNLMDDLDDHLVAIFGADHVYRMNIRHMIDFHERMHADEKIPWKCHRLVIGTGAYGRLPVMKEVKLEAERRYVELVIVPTSEAIRLIEKESAVNAILHVTC